MNRALKALFAGTAVMGGVLALDHYYTEQRTERQMREEAEALLREKGGYARLFPDKLAVDGSHKRRKEFHYSAIARDRIDSASAQCRPRTPCEIMEMKTITRLKAP